MSLHVQKRKQESSVSSCLTFFEEFPTVCLLSLILKGPITKALICNLFKNNCNLSALLNNSFKLESYQGKLAQLSKVPFMQCPCVTTKAAIITHLKTTMLVTCLSKSSTMLQVQNFKLKLTLRH